MSAAPHVHRALSECPVCGDRLVTTRLGCASCGTELVGQFAPCPFCALGDGDLDLLRVFLTSRGNLKELQSHLGVSYPTARARFNDLLDRLGWRAEGDDEPPASGEEPGDEDPAAADPVTGDRPAQQDQAAGDDVRDQVLAQVAAGTLSPAVAADLLGRLR